MRIKLVASLIFAVSFVLISMAYSASDQPTCRERNLQSLILKIEASTDLNPEVARLLLIKLRRELQAKRKLRESRAAGESTAMDSSNEESAASCSECTEDEGTK
ncbi:MAG: hypothetical protein AB9866_07940 [Syntrophobacteraceae bacterium]